MSDNPIIHLHTAKMLISHFSRRYQYISYQQN